MTDGNEGLLRGNYNRSFRPRLEDSAITIEDAHLLLRFGDSKLKARTRALLVKNGHQSP